MRKTALVVIAAAAIGLALMVPIRDRTPERNPEPAPREELTLKQRVLNRDVALTEQLCRMQCRSGLAGLLSSPGKDREGHLKNLQEQHPKMIYLKWHSVAAGPAEAGNLPQDARPELLPYLEEAEKAAARGEYYESETIHVGKDEYFVLNVPSGQNRESVTAVIRPDILNNIQIEQRKNLRIVPYPSGSRWKIRSVDSDTMRGVKVNHPEHNEGTSHYLKQEVVVKFRKDLTASQLEQICADLSCTRYQKLKLGHTYVFVSREADAKAMMDYFRKNWNPVYTEPHYIYLANQTPADDAAVYIPNDILFRKYQWNLPAIETLEGWNITRGDENIIVAVVDTGVDLDHPDLVQNLVEGYNVVQPGSPPADDVGHGTHVAGVIAASVDNVEGIAGISWHNRVMPVKVLDETGVGSTYNVAQGIIWAADNGAKVINLSLGNYVDAQFLHDAIRYAYERDVVLIAATGNDNTEEPGYPAAYPEVFAVSSTNHWNEKSPFSNFGDYVDVVAPGENIASTYSGNQYAALSGTSMASPHVAALAAMIRSVNPALTNGEVMQLMRDSAIDLGAEGKDKYYGYGLIDVKRALESALQQKNSLLLWPHRLKQNLKRMDDSENGMIR